MIKLTKLRVSIFIALNGFSPIKSIFIDLSIFVINFSSFIYVMLYVYSCTWQMMNIF